MAIYQFTSRWKYRCINWYSIDGNGDISGNLQVGGNTDVSGGIVVDGDGDISGNLQVGGNTDMSKYNDQWRVDMSGNLIGEAMYQEV